jgi:hypothetical protein
MVDFPSAYVIDCPPIAHIDAAFRIVLRAILLPAFSVRIYGHWQTVESR